MSSKFGNQLTMSTWGESHGVSVGVVIDGVPPNIPLQPKHIQEELDRRRPNQSDIVTPRKEADQCEILAGTFEGKTLGTPIAINVRNKDQRPSAYKEMATAYRPSHADYTYQQKYGIRAWHGGGRASARETIGRVAAGAIAKQVLGHLHPGISVLSWVDQIYNITANVSSKDLSDAAIEANAVRCPDATAAAKMITLIKAVRSKGDSVGGIIRSVITGVPAGLGAPVFDKLEAQLAQAMLSIPATKGFTIGSGFEGTTMLGSEHNDNFYMDAQRVRTKTNYSGGIQGGISNGEAIEFATAFKPTATILQPQTTVNMQQQDITLQAKGRHDSCVLPRAVPIVNAMTWFVLCDQFLYQRAQCGTI